MSLVVSFPTRKHEAGPKAIEHCHVTALSSDTSATITAANLSRVDFVLMGSNGLVYTAAPTYSGNTVTLTFTAPTGNYFGDALLIGV